MGMKNIVMPKELTAENGAKHLLSGEFFESVQLECTACDQDDDCEVCSGYGTFTYRVPVSWATIKQIYAMAVKHLAVSAVEYDQEFSSVRLEALEQRLKIEAAQYGEIR